MSKRCPECGIRNPEGARQCMSCGYGFTQNIQVPQPDIERGFTAYEESGEGSGIGYLRGSGNYILQEEHRGIRDIALHHKNPQIEGTVLSIEGPYLEPPDFDILGFFLKLALIIFLFPFIIGAFIAYIFLSIVFNILGMSGIMGIFNPMNIFITIGFFRGFWGAPRGREETPVRFFHLQDESGNEYMLRMKGHLRTGSLTVGQQISAWGIWKDGVLHTTRAYNHRTRSSIVVDNNGRWKRIILFIIICVTLLFILF
ncbi:zinc ribbon domain-containing protein [bacterium]|nr:zinc ribbon domain-containing protein [bacterium]